MSAGTIFFTFCALVCLVGALTTVMAKNPIRGAVGLLATILGIAGLFLKLHAQFLAAIQLIVYAGAVVVLFVFVIMLLGPDAGTAGTSAPRTRLSRLLAGLLLFSLSVHTMVMLARVSAEPTPLGPQLQAGHGSVEAVGGLLFTKAIIPFELATALLIVAVVGAIAVARARHVPKPATAPVSDPGELFHGPLHPRDAEHPLPKEPIQ
jgi:NADH-quinone oxidoreductase subunit J